MELKNERTGKIVSHDIVKAKSLRDKLSGLIGKNKDQSLIIHTRFGIHTFGMASPIDVLILDKQNRVVKIKSNLKPNRIFLWNPRYETVIELPQGKIKNSNIKIGDILAWYEASS